MRKLDRGERDGEGNSRKRMFDDAVNSRFIMLGSILSLSLSRNDRTSSSRLSKSVKIYRAPIGFRSFRLYTPSVFPSSICSVVIIHHPPP